MDHGHIWLIHAGGEISVKTVFLLIPWYPYKLVELMSNHISLVYVDIIIYPCPNPAVGLANLCCKQQLSVTRICQVWVAYSKESFPHWHRCDEWTRQLGQWAASHPRENSRGLKSTCLNYNILLFIFLIIGLKYIDYISVIMHILCVWLCFVVAGHRPT